MKTPLVYWQTFHPAAADLASLSGALRSQSECHRTSRVVIALSSQFKVPPGLVALSGPISQACAQPMPQLAPPLHYSLGRFFFQAT